MHDVAQQVPGVVLALEPVINHYGYLAVGGLILLEDFGVPSPGETVLIAAAFFAGAGQLNIFVVLLVAFVGAVVGDNIGFTIGTFGGRPLVERFGKYVFLTTKRLDKAEAFFNKHGGKIVAIARFVEGLRQLNGIIAGMSEMRWRNFVVFNVIGAALWVGFWGMVGYFGGNHVSVVYRYGSYVAAAAAVLVVAFVLYKIFRYRRAGQRG